MIRSRSRFAVLGAVLSMACADGALAACEPGTSAQVNSALAALRSPALRGIPGFPAHLVPSSGGAELFLPDGALNWRNLGALRSVLYRLRHADGSYTDAQRAALSEAADDSFRVFRNLLNNDECRRGARRSAEASAARRGETRSPRGSRVGEAATERRGRSPVASDSPQLTDSQRICLTSAQDGADPINTDRLHRAVEIYVRNRRAAADRELAVGGRDLATLAARRDGESDSRYRSRLGDELAGLNGELEIEEGGARLTSSARFLRFCRQPNMRAYITSARRASESEGDRCLEAFHRLEEHMESGSTEENRIIESTEFQDLRRLNSRRVYLRAIQQNSEIWAAEGAARHEYARTVERQVAALGRLRALVTSRSVAADRLRSAIDRTIAAGGRAVAACAERREASRPAEGEEGAASADDEPDAE